MRVNKALHTCTSWYSDAAMFGSSPHTSIPLPRGGGDPTRKGGRGVRVSPRGGGAHRGRKKRGLRVKSGVRRILLHVNGGMLWIGEGRDVLEGGEGVGMGGGGSEGGGGLAGDPPPMVPAKCRPKIFLSLNPLSTEGAEAKFWLSASNIGRGGWGGGVQGGDTPPPPAVYGRSNTPPPLAQAP